MDHPEPPVVGEYVSVYFPHPEWGKLIEFVEEKIVDTRVIPAAYELSQNFPNPFNPLILPQQFAMACQKKKESH
jgi:hypothetical protein